MELYALKLSSYLPVLGTLLENSARTKERLLNSNNNDNTTTDNNIQTDKD